MSEGNLLLNGIVQGFIRNIAKKIKNIKVHKEIRITNKGFDKLEVKPGPHEPLERLNAKLSE